MADYRVSVFVDGYALNCIQRNILHWQVDPRKLLDWIHENRGDVEDACYYTCVGPDSDAQASYLTALAHMGFRLVKKPLRVFQREDGGERIKGGVIAEIVTDIFNTIDHYDEAIIISGDADFSRIIRTLRARGKKCFVIATHGVISNELLGEASGCIADLLDLRKELERVPQENNGQKQLERTPEWSAT